MMKQVEQWDWAPRRDRVPGRTSPASTRRARRFFQALDRFTFACELSVVDNRVREGRYARAVKHVGDDKMLYGAEGGALELTESEQMSFFAHAQPLAQARSPAPLAADACSKRRCRAGSCCR